MLALQACLGGLVSCRAFFPSSCGSEARLTRGLYGVRAASFLPS